jgi:hypothetical protein
MRRLWHRLSSSYDSLTGDPFEMFKDVTLGSFRAFEPWEAFKGLSCGRESIGIHGNSTGSSCQQQTCLVIRVRIRFSSSLR